MDDPAPHVLAVNDEPLILEVYAEILEEDGFRVTTQLIPLAEPADVVALAPDVVVLDIMMGRLDWGTTFLGMLRTDLGSSGLPVVVCTATSEAVEALGPQPDAWGVTEVRKPFDIAEFLGAVRAKLDPGAGERI